jgi:hypothetical protein
MIDSRQAMNGKYTQRRRAFWLESDLDVPRPRAAGHGCE